MLNDGRYWFWRCTIPPYIVHKGEWRSSEGASWISTGEVSEQSIHDDIKDYLDMTDIEMMLMEHDVPLQESLTDAVRMVETDERTAVRK